MSHLLLIGGSRLIWRINRAYFVNQIVSQERALIIGAGSAGTLLVKQMQKNLESGINPVAFLDDDPSKQKLEIYGIKVIGNTFNIVEIIKKHRIEKIIIAIPSLSRKDLNRIFSECSKTKLKTVIMPKVEDVLIGKVFDKQLREVQVEDLLGRDTIELEMSSVSNHIQGKIILVTGAGGSIGSEICRQVSRFEPKKLVILGHGENSIYQIDMELRNQYCDILEIIPIIADVQDRERIFQIMNDYHPDIVYHAAAHKHVPLMEQHPKEAIKNNVIGTKNVADASEAMGVSNFVLISTDKAVNPTNVMGSSKRLAEMVIQNLSKKSKTKFVAVRFGNVLGSRGSVIPLFKKQIENGGPITVTDPEMTRYFMTIPEASRLVLQAGALAMGGEIFVLDMGVPVKILDLAKNLTRLSGYDIEEIGIKFTGLRPGEKMFEELLNEDEIEVEAIYPKIFVGKTVNFDFAEVEFLIENFQSYGVNEVKETIIKLANQKDSSFNSDQQYKNQMRQLLKVK